ncbi:methyltransferase [Streptomyces pluripotens]|uniref:Methyltransferase n=1 Tax=Streptomyces pluripotens TaxID=1355015 RepID=A0A221NSN0_9ACTN|nr:MULTISPECIES: SAM-dependent methyltransferase [Streptomyces]ARP68715.1 methyltransferase [Streptomyces pluripotens]ASN22971.1 methyltransferase [Streptomyces pluripotens]KIE27878.1 methyltransferase [Streptomyces sp. MUSC 125]
MTETGFSPERIDTSRPHSARMYDWFLDGKDHYPVDAEAAAEVLELFPHVKDTAWANREFMHRAARFVARQGVSQFLDVGTGIPTEPNLHQIVQEVTPSARVVYADNDPIVLRHAEALLHGTPEGRTAYLHVDIREPERIVEYAREHLDLSRPVGLSLIALLPFVTDERNPCGILRTLLEPLAPGSHLMVSHVSAEFDPEVWERIKAVYRSGGTPVQARSHAEVTRFFDGLELYAPGVVAATSWRAEPGMRVREKQPVYVGVARKP